MNDERLSRRFFGAMGLSALGAAVLGPREALASPPQKQAIAKRKYPRSRRAAIQPNPEALTGLEIEVVAHPCTEQGFALDLFLINHSSNTYNLSEAKFQRSVPNVMLHAFGQIFAMRTASPFKTTRRGIFSRGTPWRSVEIMPRNEKKREPSRLLYATFKVTWPERLHGHVQDVQQVPAFLTTYFQHNSLREGDDVKKFQSDRTPLIWDKKPGKLVRT